MLFLIGLGLYDEKDITYNGLEAIRKSAKVYLENYTSVLSVDLETLESFYNKSVILADREFVEQNIDLVLKEALTSDVSFLIVGDPFGATTHSDLFLRARQYGVHTKVIHNASILNSIGEIGLQLYKFGNTVSIVFFTENWKPTSFYEKISQNKNSGLHTLCLLDIKVKERSDENLARDRKIYEPPRYMSVNDAIKQLLETESRLKENVCNEDSIAVGISRLGSDNQTIKCGTLKELMSVDFGPPLHSLILVNEKNTHDIEWQMLEYYSVEGKTIRERMKQNTD